MATYMRIQSAGRSEPDITGAVTAAGYEGWIALESFSVIFEREDVDSEATGTQREAAREGGAATAAGGSQAPTSGSTATQTGSAPARSPASPTQSAAAGSGGASQHPTGTATQTDSAAARRLEAASRMAAGGGRDIPATLRPVRIDKLLDPSSGRLFFWVARDARAALESDEVRRDLEIHVVHGAAGSGGRAEPTIVLELTGCAPQSYDVEMRDGSRRPREQLVVRPRGIRMRYRDPEARGSRGERREAEFQTGRATSR